MRRAFLPLLFLGSPLAAAEPVPNVTARATSAQVEKLFGPQNLCTDVGLTRTPDGQLALTKNGYTGGGCMWHTGYLDRGPDEQPTVDFDLGKVVTVGRVRVWNYNGQPSRGFREVAVLASDDGQTWRATDQRFTFAKAPGTDGYVGEEYAFNPPLTARFVRFCCESTYRGGGQPDVAGLGKVRFYPTDEKPTPPPADDVFPVGSGVVNVKLPPYSAKGDGTADDTAAIQKAIDDTQATRRTVYLPAGTYRVTESLRYTPAKGHGYNNFRGAGADRTVIKLADGTFTDVAKPKPVLTLAFNGKPDGKGVHADWFNCNVGHLTIDTGRGNHGAIGLQYYSNNVGACRDVTIRGGGLIGLDLGYADQNGPCLVTNIRVDGFATGVRSGATVNSQTAEHVTVTGFTKFGWENTGQCLAIRKLSAAGTGTGFRNGFGVVALIDSEFTGSGPAAVTNGETLFARNLRTTGFGTAIENKREKDGPTPNAAGPAVEEWVSTKPLTLFPTDNPRSLNLPVKETPTVPADPPATWANVRAFRQVTDPDDSAAFQRAVDSGATTVYFPAGGHFHFGTPVELRGQVRRVVGHFAGVHSRKRDQPIWRVAADGPPVLSVEDLIGDIFIEHAAARTLVVKNGQGVAGKLSGAGELFLENVVSEWDFAGGRTWARQHNNERAGTHMTNAGGTLWILGLKTERGGTLIDTTADGKTEVLGGLSYTTNKGKLAPMFTVADGQLSVTMGEVCYTGDPYTRLVSETRAGAAKVLNRADAPLRPSFLQGGQLPLFVGRP